MHTPAEDVVVDTRYIYALALALVGLAAATSAILFLLIDKRRTSLLWLCTATRGPERVV